MTIITPLRINLGIYYATVEGQTKKIADHVAQYASGIKSINIGDDKEAVPAEVHVDVHNVQELRDNYEIPKESDAVVLAGPLHVGQHPHSLLKFIQHNSTALKSPSLTSGFLSVSLSAASEGPTGQQAATQKLTEFLSTADFHPCLASTVAGALKYTHYGFFKKRLMRWISYKNYEQSAKELGKEFDKGVVPGDYGKDYEFTQWEKVDHFVDDLLGVVGGKKVGGE